MARRGFSLLELVLVVVIVGIIAAIAVPRYGTALSRYRADAAMNRLAAELERAISRAEAGSASYLVTVDLQTETMTVAGPLPATTVVTQTLFTDAPYHADLVVNASTSESITFDGYGRPDRTITFTVRSGDAQRTVMVSVTGEVTTS